MRPIASHRDRSQSVPMTPMIDVVFQLLIFFICTASFQQLEELLPTHMLTQGTSKVAVETKEEPERHEPIIVNLAQVNGQTTWAIAGRQLSGMDEVRQVLSALGGEPALRAHLPVILDIAPDVPLGNVIDVYDLCLAIRFEKIKFAAAKD